MKRSHARLLAAVAALGVAALLGARWLRPPPAPPAAPETPAPAAPVASAPRVAEPVAPAASPDPAPEEPASLDPELERLRIEAEIEERGRQLALAPAADARWHEAVDQGDYSADDLDPAVRQLFRRLELEPRYTEGGRIEGLMIEDLPRDHPLAQAGFRTGDRIDRIQGVALRDPAELPSLLARLGPRIELCAEREGAELCRDLDLE